MRATSKGIYALHAMIALAENSSPKKPLTIKKIAEAEGLSTEFLQQIFFRLRKAGMIGAIRGPGGGFFLKKPMDAIRIIDLLEAAGEGITLARASAEPRPVPDPGKRSVESRAGDFWVDLESQLKDFASRKSLADYMD